MKVSLPYRSWWTVFLCVYVAAAIVVYQKIPDTGTMPDYRVGFVVISTSVLFIISATRNLYRIIISTINATVKVNREFEKDGVRVTLGVVDSDIPEIEQKGWKLVH